ncbi:MAG: hypothetical protein HYX27_01145 [Acidobacteria bacterium]|nr:hypothetical protein [Acidobacteriota bacterium]
MRNAIAVALCLVLPAASFPANGGHKVNYDGGSISSVKPGTNLRIFVSGESIRLMKDDMHVATIPPAAVTELSYGQDVHRRVGAAIGLAVVSFGIGALMALAKSKKHYIGLTWDDKGKKGGIAFQANKDDYRGLLAGLEGVTGKKAVNTDAMTVKN